MTSSPNRLVATVFGAVYLLVDLAGFLVTGGLPFAGQQGNALVVVDVNPLHNVVHLGIGLALLLASRSVAGARATTTTIGAVYLLVGVLGLFLIGSGASILALNGADNVLHLASAVLLLAVGLGADKATAPSTATA